MKSKLSILTIAVVLGISSLINLVSAIRAPGPSGVFVSMRPFGRVLAVLIPLSPPPLTLPAVSLFFALAGGLLHGLLGLIAGVVSVKWDHFAAWLGLVVIPISFLSGAFYPIGNLPAIGQALVSWNPVFYAIDGFRYGFTGSSEGAPLLGAAILLAIDAALFVAVYRLFASGYKLKA